ncbi:MAG: CtsR family transcriptional regulator [Clostridia bacterium]
MPNISDLIENFLLKTIGDDNELDISRNELASFFSCAPSQINYVLETRFTSDKGFLKLSRRGNGGFVKLTRIDMDEDTYVSNLIVESIGDELTFKRAVSILDKLCSDDVITIKEKSIISVAISEDSLSMPFTIKDRIRASMFKNILLQILKEKDN